MRRTLVHHTRRLWSDESGATSIEYALILGLMFLVLLTALSAFSDASTGLFSVTMKKLRNAMGG